MSFGSGFQFRHLGPQRSEARADFFSEDFRLFPGREVAAFLYFVEMDQFGIGLLCSTLRGWVEFVRKDANGHRDVDALSIEVAHVAFIRLAPQVQQ